MWHPFYCDFLHKLTTKQYQLREYRTFDEFLHKMGLDCGPESDNIVWLRVKIPGLN